VGDRGRRGTPLASAHAAAVLRLGLEDRADGTDGRGSPDPAGFSRRGAAIGGVTVAMLVAAGIGIPDSGRIAANGGTGRGSVEGSPGFTAVGSAMGTQGGRRQEHDQMQTPGVRAALAAGVVMIASGAGAQQPAAVQWRVEDGGNGHWYQIWITETPVSWVDAQTVASSFGGSLLSVNSAQEHSFMEPLLQNATDSSGCHPAVVIGLSKQQGSPWRWVDGADLTFTNWTCGEPYDPDYPEGKFVLYSPAGCESYCVAHLRWDDTSANYVHPIHRGVAIEWSTDCNNDNIVDYGQILLGQLVDTNTNGIPDICELPTCRDVDLFRNGVINGADLGILLSEWGSANANTVSDINRDGRVDGSDLGTLLAFWGPCVP
jgi:hypothetical protein